MINMLLRFDPFRDFDTIFRDIERRNGQRATSVPFDAIRRENEIELRFDLPGYDKDDIDVTVENGVLKLTAERTWTVPEDEQVLASERFHGKVQRWVELGDHVDTDKVKATFDNGVLRLVFPLVEKATPRHIEIGGPALEAESTKVEA